MCLSFRDPDEVRELACLFCWDHGSGSDDEDSSGQKWVVCLLWEDPWDEEENVNDVTIWPCV